jgi:hypothetical protein
MTKLITGFVIGAALATYIARRPNLVAWVFNIVRPDIINKKEQQ